MKHLNWQVGNNLLVVSLSWEGPLKEDEKSAKEDILWMDDYDAKGMLETQWSLHNKNKIESPWTQVLWNMWSHLSSLFVTLLAHVEPCKAFSIAKSIINFIYDVVNDNGHVLSLIQYATIGHNCDNGFVLSISSQELLNEYNHSPCTTSWGIK